MPRPATDAETERLVVVGLRSEDLDALPWDDASVFAVLSRRRYDAMPEDVRQRFDGILALDLPGLGMDEYERLVPTMAQWVRTHVGPSADVVSLYEHTLVAAARLREELGLPGMPSEVAVRSRDKTWMAAAVAARGVPVVDTLPVGRGSDVSTVEGWLRDRGAGGVIVKPRRGAASGGVRELDSVDELVSTFGARGFEDQHEVQPFHPEPICHLDAVVRGGEVVFLSASRYLGTTLRYQRDGEAMGSVTLDDARAELALAFVTEVVAAIGITDSVVHVEAFLEAAGFRFLELGARFGGINVTAHVKRVWGVDLRVEAVAVQRRRPSGGARQYAVDEVLTTRRTRPGGVAGGASGWVIVPRSRSEVSVVSSVDLPTGVPGVVEVVSDSVGDLLPRRGNELDAVVRMVLDLPEGTEADIEALVDSVLGRTEVVLDVVVPPEERAG